MNKLLPLLLALAACGSHEAGPSLASGATPATAGASAWSTRSRSAEPRTPPVVKYTLYDLGGKGDPVLLIHGWAGQHQDEQVMGEGLKKMGFAPYLIDLVPSDAKVSDTAFAVAQAIDDVLRAQGAGSLYLVAHSMGGLDSRYYLTFLGGRPRVRALVTVATPHHGTMEGYIAHGPAGIDLRPGSQLLADLEQMGPPQVRTTSIFSRTDEVVVPQMSARIDWGRNIEHWGLTHNGILRDPGVIEEVRQALRGTRR